jgi:phosphate transport system substrate-binding protein
MRYEKIKRPCFDFGGSIMKKLLAIILALAAIVGVLAACGGNGDDAQEITVVSREDGSGTRGAFVELLGIQESVDGTTTDRTTAEAVIANSTSIVMTNVAQNPDAIGYIALGSLNDSVTALRIDGVEATPENIMSGAYAVQRPFIIVYRDDLSDVARDFMNFIMSAEGQAVVAGRNYIVAVPDANSYTGGGLSGRIVVSGSTSVVPIMEHLREAYIELNPDVEVEVHSAGTTAGIVATTDGTADIGMSSREIRPAELEQVNEAVIAFDGIVVIVNNDNPVNNLTAEQVRDIFIGEITDWSEVN